MDSVQIKRAATESVRPRDLKAGDIVWEHGSRFELTEEYIIVGRNVSAEEYETTGLRGWKTKYLGAVIWADGSTSESIPRAWIEREGSWHIQGNDRARYARQIATPAILANLDIVLTEGK